MQEAEAEQRGAAKQTKAAAKRAALEAAGAQRAEEARKRHEFMQETKKVLPTSCSTYYTFCLIFIHVHAEDQ